MAWKRVREEILNESPLCRECAKLGRTCGAVEVDHILPLSLGGTNDRNNLQPICRECHERKTAKENSYRIPINEDGFPTREMRKQVLLRQAKHKEAVKRWWKKRRELERKQDP